MTCYETARHGNAKTCPEGAVVLPADLNGSLWWNESSKMTNKSVLYSCREGAGCAFKRDKSDSFGWGPFISLSLSLPLSPSRSLSLSLSLFSLSLFSLFAVN